MIKAYECVLAVRRFSRNVSRSHIEPADDRSAEIFARNVRKSIRVPRRSRPEEIEAEQNAQQKGGDRFPRRRDAAESYNMFGVEQKTRGRQVSPGYLDLIGISRKRV